MRLGLPIDSEALLGVFRPLSVGANFFVDFGAPSPPLTYGHLPARPIERNLSTLVRQFEHEFAESL